MRKLTNKQANELVTLGKGIANVRAEAAKKIGAAFLTLINKACAFAPGPVTERDWIDVYANPMTQALGAAGYENSVLNVMLSRAKINVIGRTHGTGDVSLLPHPYEDSVRKRLQELGIVAATGKGRKPRQPEGKPAKGDAPTAPTAPTAPEAGNAMQQAMASATADKPLTFKPGRKYTADDYRQAALILDGSPDYAPKIVQAFKCHRDQLHKFIDSLLSD